MLDEAVDYLNCRPGKVYVDCTLGGSGHAGAICRKIIPGGVFIGLDQDEDAIKYGKHILKEFDLEIHLFNENFINLPEILSQLNIKGVDGILLDLGLSFHQIVSSGRGFSFNKDEFLDMRMDVRTKIKAWDIVNKMSEKDLKKIFKDLGEERQAGTIARRIVYARNKKPVQTSKELADLVCRAVYRKESGRKRSKSRGLRKIHPATRVFMALRIYVNKELERLSGFMETAADLLNPKGRLCAISFHSLEDRIVKHKIKAMEKGCICPPDFPQCICNKKPLVRSLIKKIIQPTEKETALNPMARSAKLRAFEKI